MKRFWNEYCEYWNECSASLKKHWKGVTVVMAIYCAFYAAFWTFWYFWDNIEDFFRRLFKKNRDDED